MRFFIEIKINMRDESLFQRVNVEVNLLFGYID